MATRNQVMDIRPNSDGISQAESNEQQRNWTEDFLRKKSNDPMSNYDLTRTHLNFEVARGGVIQLIDKSKPIMQMMADNLAARSIKDPNSRENLKRRQNTLAQFIFGGSREQMNKLAFGSQKLNLDKGADNSHLTRNQDIEKWAKDVYDFVAHHFGEANIVSFYVHLDETNVHAHCTLIPVDKEKNRISWRSIFGQNSFEMGRIFSQLHDEFSKEVGKKWGLERGNSIRETGARHRSTYEYKRELVNDVNQLEYKKKNLESEISTEERKLKSLSTMIANLNAKREQIMNEIDLLAGQLGQDGVDVSELAARIAQLRKEVETIDQTLQRRNQQKEYANKALSALTAKLNAMYSEHERMRSVLGDDSVNIATLLQRNILATYNSMLTTSLEPLVPTLSLQQHDILQESGFAELAQGSNHVINCAMLLAMQYVKEATTYAESCGGSTTPSNWCRNKDEDDEHWWRRCIATAAAMMKPMAKKHYTGVRR